MNPKDIVKPSKVSHTPVLKKANRDIKKINSKFVEDPDDDKKCYEYKYGTLTDTLIYHPKENGYSIKIMVRTVIFFHEDIILCII